MKAYKNTIKLTEAPDVGDIQSEGRRSAIGRIRRGDAREPRFKNGVVRFADGTPGRNLNAGKVCHNDRGYCRPSSKAATRRYLKRIARIVDIQFELAAEGLGAN